MTPTQEFLERYKETAVEADSLGRLIKVGWLRPSQQLRVSEMTPGLEGDTEMPGPDGEMMKVSRRSLPLIAAHVRAIGDNPMAFPTSRAQLDSMMDMLDQPGMQAAIRAISKLTPIVSFPPAEDVNAG